MIKRIIWVLIVQLCWLGAQAQRSFVFLPELHGRTVDGLLQVKVVSPGTDAQVVRLTVTVTEQRSGKILDLRTPPFTLMPGTQPLPLNLGRQATMTFAAGKAATVCRQTGVFPEGEYEYCFQLTDAGKNNGEIAGEQCFDYYLQPFSPLLLITPADGDAICDKRPALFWQPLMPAIPGLQYRVMLTEVKEGQQKAEALNYNPPVIQQMAINTPMLFYPPAAKELEEGKRYAWQVTAYRNELLLANSEIWEFTVTCKDSTHEPPPAGFRDLADLAKGNFYVANGRVLFALRNIYEAGPLKYSIQCLTRPEQKIRKLPAVKLLRGSNQVVIDLSGNAAFVDGYFYVMTVTLPNGEQKQLRFLYKTMQE